MQPSKHAKHTYFHYLEQIDNTYEETFQTLTIKWWPRTKSLWFQQIFIISNSKMHDRPSGEYQKHICFWEYTLMLKGSNDSRHSLQKKSKKRPLLCFLRGGGNCTQAKWHLRWPKLWSRCKGGKYALHKNLILPMLSPSPMVFVFIVFMYITLFF